MALRLLVQSGEGDAGVTSFLPQPMMPKVIFPRTYRRGRGLPFLVERRTGRLDLWRNPGGRSLAGVQASGDRPCNDARVTAPMWLSLESRMLSAGGAGACRASSCPCSACRCGEMWARLHVRQREDASLGSASPVLAWSSIALHRMHERSKKHLAPLWPELLVGIGGSVRAPKSQL